MLDIKDLKATIDGKDILQGLSLQMKPGEVHAIMGPNGSGKSTLAKVVSGHPDVEDVSGDVLLDGDSMLDLEPDERANKGLFLAFQYPVDIPGVNNAEFLRMAYNAKQKSNQQEEVDPFDFNEIVKEKLEILNMKERFLDRPVNHGFSGGEKKRNEIFQMLMLEPMLAVLDETDSGLDIDALQTVAKGVNAMRTEQRSFVVVTHYQRLLDHIVPDHVHVLADGRIIHSGDQSLAHKLEAEGYGWLEEVA